MGVKEASSDITKITKIILECGNRFSVWSGCDEMITPVLSLGGKGVISVLSNVLPQETQAMARAALAGDFDSATSLQVCLQPLTEELFREVNPIPIKEAMKLAGFDCGSCRLPLTPMTPENREKLQRVLRPMIDN